jgi:hypothetical protein
MGTQLISLTSTKPKAVVDWKWRLLESLAQNAFESFFYLSFPLHKIIQPMLGIDTKGCPRIKIFSIWWIGFFLKRSKRKPCCHFISHQWMWSLDV